jgi:hypothetical protein
MLPAGARDRGLQLTRHDAEEARRPSGVGRCGLRARRGLQQRPSRPSLVDDAQRPRPANRRAGRWSTRAYRMPMRAVDRSRPDRHGLRGKPRGRRHVLRAAAGRCLHRSGRWSRDRSRRWSLCWISRRGCDRRWRCRRRAGFRCRCRRSRDDRVPDVARHVLDDDGLAAGRVRGLRSRLRAATGRRRSVAAPVL